MSEMRDPVVPAGITGYEVLQRVRRARDWARSEVGKLRGPNETAVIERTVYQVVADVLDEILDPGSHVRS